MPDDIGHIRAELKALLPEILELGIREEKEEGEADNRERIRKKLTAITKNIMQSLTEFSDEEKDEIMRNIEDTFVKKNQVERFRQFSDKLSNFLTSGFQVVTGPTQEQMGQQLFAVIKHAEGLWTEAKMLFENSRYSTACFLSIVCIEECAKINFGGLQITLFFTNTVIPFKRSRGKYLLNSHLKKHLMAACSAALVNSRMDRIFGIDKIDSFISDCEEGRLEKLRQSCLYADTDKARQTVLLPMAQISRENALFYTCLAGELLVEEAGIDYSISEGLKNRVKEFEKENGINAGI